MIKPLPGYVLVEPIEDDSKTSGGLYLPDSSKDKPMKGKVVDITYNETLDKKEWFNTMRMENLVQVGSVVIYKKWTNQEVTHEGKDYLLVAFNELLATI